MALILSGASTAGFAQQADTSAPITEVVVTATQREDQIQNVPYNISAVSGSELASSGVTDLVSLAHDLPSFTLVDLGVRYESAEIPVIRGINASNVYPNGGQILNQSPVGIYIGNSPIGGYLQLTDISRVEILRGPQGTSYGAGALGGALRVIPNDPVLGAFSADVQVSAGYLDHASDPSASFQGFANIPIGDELAFRVAVKYAYEPGFINEDGLVARTGSAWNSAPVLANPASPTTSGNVFLGSDDNWNWSKTTTVQGSLLWQRNAFKAELRIVDSSLKGNGGDVDNPDWQGGAYGIDPTTSLPAGGQYKSFSAVQQPYTRNTAAPSLDLAYDAGFATVSSTSSYYNTHGDTIDNDTYHVFGFTPFEEYYTGSPVNPHFISIYNTFDTDHTFSQELRMVSHTEPGQLFDYIVGGFFSRQQRSSTYEAAAPGTDTYSQAEGCTAPYVYGAGFPNCLVVLGPQSVFYNQAYDQNYLDRSIYGELTWHATQALQLTVGARHFWDTFTATQDFISYPFLTSYEDFGTATNSSYSGTLWKVDPSFEYAKDQNIYATWSQGFRRGGANSFALNGPLGEAPELLAYQPDKTSNFEVGAKGKVGAYLYSADVFLINWEHPQISGSTPNTGTAVVYNGNTARSTGFELESSGPLLIDALQYHVSYSYADARLTSGFSLPANNGAGGISPGEIVGTSGERLPGSAKNSASATLDYMQPIAPDYQLVATVNATYTGTVLDKLPTAGKPIQSFAGYILGNLSVGVEHEPWRVSVYGTNITDRRAEQWVSSHLNPAIVGALANVYGINPPRELGVRLGYSFK